MKWRTSRKMVVQKQRKRIRYAMEKQMGIKTRGGGGKAIACMRKTEGGETDIKGREDLDDRNRYYVHYNGDGGRM